MRFPSARDGVECRQKLHGADSARSRCPIIGSPPEKSPLGRQFTGKNPPRPAAGNFLWGWQYFNKGRYQFRDYLSPGGFFMGKHFSVTPARVWQV